MAKHISTVLAAVIVAGATIAAAFVVKDAIQTRFVTMATKENDPIADKDKNARPAPPKRDVDTLEVEIAELEKQKADGKREIEMLDVEIPELEKQKAGLEKKLRMLKKDVDELSQPIPKNTEYPGSDHLKKMGAEASIKNKEKEWEQAKGELNSINSKLNLKCRRYETAKEELQSINRKLESAQNLLRGIRLEGNTELPKRRVDD